MNADADLIAAGLLLDLKPSKKLTLGVKGALHVIGYALLDFDYEFGIKEVGVFAPYGKGLTRRQPCLS
jgi:hypothetical protein